MSELFDWKMISFISISLVYEYWTFYHLPRIYYCDIKAEKNNDDTNNNKVA